MKLKRREDPCACTGSGCRWKNHSWFDDRGRLESIDAQCDDCGRWRDWKRDEWVAPAPESDEPFLTKGLGNFGDTCSS